MNEQDKRRSATAISILRNPHGFNEETIRIARLEVCNELEKCKRFLRDIDYRMRDAWVDGKLPAVVWPQDFIERMKEILK